MIQPFHERLAELYLTSTRRRLTDAEGMELQHCLAANFKMCWEMAYLKNLSLMASMTNDISWQNEVCLDIQELEMTGTRQRKKPPKGDKR